MKQRENISSGAIWEDKVGYSRAVKVDDLIEISGTTAVNGTEIVAVGNPYEQTKFIIEKFSSVLEDAGSSLKDIIRVRIYVREINDWKKVGKAFYEYFYNIKPAVTLVEVNSLIDPQLLVEMEATAIITE
ncbi:MAG: RidA family protein [Ignavibacteriaceae bacterium]|jgi:enamine deaminase RidA (YjgF/YER057c/UK114 family)